MVKDIFFNLAVNDLDRSIAFFTQLGFTFNPQMTDTSGTCMILGEHMYAMLLTKERFQSFTTKKICDSSTHVEVLTTIALESPQKVDEIVAKALAAGGTSTNNPQDHGFMYEHDFYDIDGHAWGVIAFTAAA